jgi:hypothetical protein
MKQILLVLVAVAVVGLGAGCKKPADSAATQYTCPMHPEIVTNAPGKCPKCQMDLKPKT